MHVDSTPALFASQASASSGEGVASAVSEGAFATVMATSMREAEAHVSNGNGSSVATEEGLTHAPNTPHAPASAEHAASGTQMKELSGPTSSATSGHVAPAEVGPEQPAGQQHSLASTHREHQAVSESGSGITDEASPKAGATLAMQVPVSSVQVPVTDKPAVLGEKRFEQTDDFLAQDGRQPHRDEIQMNAGSLNLQEASPTSPRPVLSSDDARERISPEEAPELVERAVTDKPSVLGEEAVEVAASEVSRNAPRPGATQRENQEPRVVSRQDVAPKLEGADRENGQPVRLGDASQASSLSEAHASTNEKLRIIDAPDVPLADSDTPQVQTDQTGRQQEPVEASQEKHADSASQTQQALAETSPHVRPSPQVESETVVERAGSAVPRGAENLEDVALTPLAGEDGDGDAKASLGRAERQEALRPGLQSLDEQPDGSEATAKVYTTNVRRSEAFPNPDFNQNGERLNQVFAPESSDSANLGGEPEQAASTMGTFQAATLPSQPWTSRSGQGQEDSAALASREALGTNTTSVQPGTHQESRDVSASRVLPEDHRQGTSIETRPTHTATGHDVAAVTGDVARADGRTDQPLSVEKSAAREGGSQHASEQTASPLQARTASDETLQPSPAVDITRGGKFAPAKEYPESAFVAVTTSQGSTEAKPIPDGESQVSGRMPAQEQHRANGATHPAHTAEMLKPADSLVDRSAAERPEVSSPARTASPVAASSESVSEHALQATAPSGEPKQQTKTGSSVALDATFSKGTGTSTFSDATSAAIGEPSRQVETEKGRPAVLNQPSLEPKTGSPTVAEKTGTPMGSPIPANQEATSGKVEQAAMETAGADLGEAQPQEQRAAMTTSRAQEPSHERFGTPLASSAKHAMPSAPADLSSRSFFEQSVVLDGPEKPENSSKTHIQLGDGDVVSAVQAGTVATEASGKSFEATEKNSRSALEASSATAEQATATPAEDEQPEEDASREDKPAFSGAQALASAKSESTSETAFGDAPSVVEVLQPEPALSPEQALPEEEVVAAEVLDSELTVPNAGSSESRSSLGSTMTSTLNRSVLSAAWLRTMTQSQLPFSVGDGWQVLEMKLDEGDGTVTIKAKPGDERVAVSVGFSDPTLRALASAQVDRIQEALQEAYNTSVDLSFADGSNASAGQHSQGGQGGSGSASHTTALPGTEPEADRGLRTRMTGALNEWVG